jgi:hypothetical protein
VLPPLLREPQKGTTHGHCIELPLTRAALKTLKAGTRCCSAACCTPTRRGAQAHDRLSGRR